MPKKKCTTQSNNSTLPFYPDEVDAIKKWLQTSVARRGTNGKKHVDGYWHEILAAAQVAVINKPFEDVPLKRSRVGQALSRIAAAAKPILPKNNAAMLSALAFGAARLKLIKYPKTVDQTTYIKILSKLTSRQLKDSAARAKTEPLWPDGPKPMLSSDTGGRPSAEAFDDYVAKLADIYERAANVSLPLIAKWAKYPTWKPVLTFIKLCLKPQEFRFQDSRHPNRLIRNAIDRKKGY